MARSEVAMQASLPAPMRALGRVLDRDRSGFFGSGRQQHRFGINANAGGLNMIAIGANANAQPPLTGAPGNSIAVGANSNSARTHSTVVVALANATGIGAIAIGGKAEAIANNTTASSLRPDFGRTLTPTGGKKRGPRQ